LAFAALLYANTLQNDFVLDDRALVETNPLIQSLTHVPTLFASDYAAPQTGSGLYRPLVTTSYAINFALGGREPLGYHGVNLGLHALVSVLVWALCRRLTGDGLTAGAAGFLFAAHAIHTEAVANVVGRAELLAALFFLLSFLGYIGSRETRGWRAAGLYTASLAAYLLALLSKESALTLLGVILLHDFVYVEETAQSPIARLRGMLRRHWPRYAGYLLVALLYLGVRFLALGPAQALPPPLPTDNPLVTLDLPWRWLNALRVALQYLGLLCFPLHLSYDYSYNQIPMLTSLADPRTWGVLALPAVAIAILVWSYRSWKDLFFALGFYLVTFSVVSNLVVLIGTIMGERLVYVPSLGFCLALTLFLRRLCGRLPVAPRTARVIFLGVMVLGVGLHSARTLVRNPNWESQERLYLHDVEVVPGSTKALINAAYALSALGRTDDAISLLEEQIRRGARGPVLYNNLGFLLIDRETDVKRGVALLEQAVAKRPNDPEFLDSLGWGYYKLGRLREARDVLRKSLELNDWSESAGDRRAHLEMIERALQPAD
jgi:tetratricopeptide (TPR) repeat protein